MPSAAGGVVLAGTSAVILETFDHAFVLNLDCAPGQYRLADQRLRAAGIVAERFAAIAPAESGAFPSAGARGCLASHCACVRLARERGYRSVLIFEDDVILRPGFARLWSRLQPAAASLDYDLLYFYQWRQLALLPHHLRFVPITGTLCTHAYAVRAPYYDPMLARLQASDRAGEPIDLALRRAGARVFAPTYNLAGQDAGVSAVTGGRKLRRWSSHSDTYCGVPVSI